MIEAVVGKVQDFKDGEMREVELGGEHRALLVKDGGELHAVSHKCTHYGAPLIKGVYSNGTVRCPWHGACFNVKSGDIEDFPGLDSLHKFQVEIRGDDVVVKAEPASLENFRKVKPMVKKSADNKNTILLVGGGPASVVCAETLRQQGYTGRLVLLTREAHLPYDRIKLSKAMSIKPEDIALRKQEFYDNFDIELKLGQEVTAVSPSDKSVTLSSGETMSYSSLLLATGGTPRKLPIPGADLDNVMMLRTPSDANAIAEKAAGKNVVIVGSSFIGMEVASCLAEAALSVSVVDLVTVPFQATLGPALGGFMQKLHESKGVKFHFETSVKEFQGQDGRLCRAVLANGATLEADLAVMGVGVVPATDFIKESGLSMTSRGFVTVNKKMETNIAGVFAAGDIVEFPLYRAGDAQCNVQHWQMAHQHGRIAGLNMAGKATDVHSVPYFWTVQYGKSIRYCGYAQGYDDVVVHGNMEDGKFLAYYTRGEEVVAAASLGWDPVVSQAAELMARGTGGGSISKAEVKSDPTGWTSRLCKL